MPGLRITTHICRGPVEDQVCAQVCGSAHAFLHKGVDCLSCCFVFVFPLLVKVHFKTMFLSYKQKLSGAQCHFYGLQFVIIFSKQ